MKKRLFFVMIVAVSMLCAAMAIPALAEDAAVASAGTDVLTLLESLVPEGTMTWVTVAVTICAAVAVVLPAPKDGGNVIYKWLYYVVQWMALNVGRAKNASTAKSNG